MTNLMTNKKEKFFTRFDLYCDKYTVRSRYGERLVLVSDKYFHRCVINFSVYDEPHLNSHIYDMSDESQLYDCARRQPWWLVKKDIFGKRDLKQYNCFSGWRGLL